MLNVRRNYFDPHANAPFYLATPREVLPKSRDGETYRQKHHVKNKKKPLPHFVAFTLRGDMLQNGKFEEEKGR